MSHVSTPVPDTRGPTMPRYEKSMTPEFREKYLAILNDPDLLSLKPEIKLLEDMKAELQSCQSEEPEAMEAITHIEGLLRRLRKGQAKLDKR